jgi:hypothetical protein
MKPDEASIQPEGINITTHLKDCGVLSCELPSFQMYQPFPRLIDLCTRIYDAIDNNNRNINDNDNSNNCNYNLYSGTSRVVVIIKITIINNR